MLTRPVDAQLYLTFRQLDLWRIADVLLGFALSSVALHRLGRPISASQILAFAVTFTSAVAVLYSVWVILMCLAFWFVAIENLPTVFDALFEAARYPASAYPKALRVVFVYVLPVAWTTTIPASALVGRLSAHRGSRVDLRWRCGADREPCRLAHSPAALHERRRLIRPFRLGARFLASSVVAMYSRTGTKGDITVTDTRRGARNCTIQ